jgi:hypothetical protein
MVELDRPLKRLVKIAHEQRVIVELVPGDGGIPAHIKLRMEGARESFFTRVIEAPKG